MDFLMIVELSTLELSKLWIAHIEFQLVVF